MKVFLIDTKMGDTTSGDEQHRQSGAGSTERRFRSPRSDGRGCRLQA